ncbi:mulitfunctional phosphoenolpyruvate-protein phosphotransferase/phosphocarrier protein HPr/PTS system fructose-like transporter subunit IIA [Enterobacter cloacae subsp. cloacae GS1]|nr:mulitfunctional phosphoenolpyruvate-protein phosphotransferase/phosphocarrier protein HPr/PTS system fructose-like transporter subunit IIA [Enterobacter cloacae subsp. cloacae GS1]
MDIGGDKQIPYLNIPQEENPFLGYRAVRIYPEFADLFRTQPARDLTRRRKRQCAVDDPDGAQPRSDFMDQTGAAKRS